MKNMTISLSLCFILFFAVLAGAGPARYLEEVTADNPVLWHPFDFLDVNINGFGSRIPYGGNVAYAIDGATTSEDSVLDLSLSLDGDNYSLAADAPDPNIFSVEVWAKCSAPTTGWGGALLSYRGGVAGYILYLHDDDQIDVHIGTGALYVGTVTVTDPNQWHQYVLTFDNAYNDGVTPSTAKFYIDGQLKLTTTGDLVRTTGVGPVNIGNDISCPLPEYCSDYYTGFIDEYSVYDTVLSIERIEAHYLAATESDTVIPDDGIVPIVKLLFDDPEAITTENLGSLGGTQNLPQLYGQKVAGSQPPVIFDSSTFWQQAGYDSTVQYSDGNSLPEMSEMTLAFWVSPSLLDSSWRNILSSSDESGKVLSVLWSQNSDEVHGDLHVDNGSRRITAYGVLSSNTWTHIAVSFNSGIARVYIDGVLAETTGFYWGASVAASTEGMSIADPRGSGTLYGGIDNVFIFDVSLSQEQIQALMTTNNAPESICRTIEGYGLTLSADLNSDCHVNIFDLEKFVNEWLLCLNPTDEFCDLP